MGDAALDAWRVTPGPVYDAYWRFAAARQEVYERRLTGAPPPWTTDPVLSRWRFTNAYRAADRVSQFLIRHVIYAGSQEPIEVLFRIVLFKWFNRIDTWEYLVAALGEPRLTSFDPGAASRALTARRLRGAPIYSAAYIVPPVPGEKGPKHDGHLNLTMRMIESDLLADMASATSLAEVFDRLRTWPGIGEFLAYQLAIDINYSTIIDFDEDEFVAPGPGAIDGLSKVWPGFQRRNAVDLIRRTRDEQNEQFERLNLKFGGLFGRPLKLIDCQNLYCEISKYSREAHPEVVGVAGRSRIKQAYEPSAGAVRPVPQPFFPPKWALAVPSHTKVKPWTLLVDELPFDEVEKTSRRMTYN